MLMQLKPTVVVQKHFKRMLCHKADLRDSWSPILICQDVIFVWYRITVKFNVNNTVEDSDIGIEGEQKDEGQSSQVCSTFVNIFISSHSWWESYSWLIYTKCTGISEWSLNCFSSSFVVKFII